MIIAYADGIGTARITPDDGRSILHPTVARLSSLTGARPVRVTWPASMAGAGGSQSWAVAAHKGVLDLDRIAAEHPDEQIVLLAYSGGNRVVHDWLDTRPAQHHRVAAVGLMSDPYRPAGRQQHGVPDPGGWGICGQRLGPIPGRTFWTAAPADVITCCPPDSPLRTLADLSDQIPGSLLADLAGHLGRGDWQLAWHMGLWRRDPLAYLRGLGPRLDQARRGVEGYLGGRHTVDYTRPHHTADGRTGSLAHRLADSIAWALNHPKEKP